MTYEPGPPDEPSGYETFPNGRREPRWTHVNYKLQELDERMALAMWGRIHKRRRLYEELYELLRGKQHG